MKIAFNPSTVEALIAPPNNKDITFDLRGQNIFARGVKFCGTDTNTWRDIKINNVSIDSNILDLRDGDNTTLTNTNGVVTINSTWRPVVDNLTSDSTTSSLSANQGKVLKSLIDGKSNSGHTHDDRYLKLTGGIMQLGEGLKFHADENYFGTYLDARIISLLDGNGKVCDGGLIIDERGTLDGKEYVTELLRIRDSEFKWKGSNILHSRNSNINGSTITINGSSLTVSKSDHTHSNYVTALGTNGNYLTWTKNGSTNNIIVPYATTSPYLTNGFSATYTNKWDCNAPDRVVYSDYGSPGRSITNAPSGWNYGTLLELGHTNYNGLNGNLNILLMWDVAHNTTLPGTLWFRGKDDINGWAKSWAKVITDLNISSILSNYYTKSETDGKYVTLTTPLTISGSKTFTTGIKFNTNKNGDANLGSGDGFKLFYNETSGSNFPGSYYNVASFMTGYTGFLLACYGGADLSLKYRHRLDNGTWHPWKTLAFTTDIPNSLKNPYALTISLNGTSQGSYDGSATKNINITPGSIGAATSDHNHDGRYVRYYTVTTLDCNNLAIGLTAAGVSATNAAHTNHSAFLYISDVGTPFQIQIPDSSVPYIYKRYYSSGTWSEWFKLNAGYADSAGSASNLTVHLYLSNTDTTWWPLIWGGSSHNNTNDSTGTVYKSYDKLSWLTSSLTLYATNIQTENIKHLSVGGGIYWNPYVESTTDDSDAASITLVKSGVAGGTTLVLSLMNDANDTILFQTNGSARLYHNSYPILTTLNTYVSNNKGYINGTEITLVNNANLLDGLDWNNFFSRRFYTFDLSSYSLSNFYPLFFVGSDIELDCEIHSNGGEWQDPYNQNRLHFQITSKGWTDTRLSFHLLSQDTYDNNEITIGSIGIGTRQGGICIWVRGGRTYRVCSNREPLFKPSNYTYGDEIYSVGTNIWGGTNTNVTLVWKNDSTRKNALIATLTDNVASATNADTVDGYHANGLLTALSNSNNGVSITVGGTTKSVSNISVNYAASAGSAGSVAWDNVTGKPSTFAPSAHTHKWADITDHITKLSLLTNDIGFVTGSVSGNTITINGSSTTWSNTWRPITDDYELGESGTSLSSLGSLTLYNDLLDSIPNPTDYYWANVKISASSSTTTSPTVHTLTATRVCAGYNPEIDNSISCSNWFRSSGDTGWYNATYLGGWYMSDTSWIRAHNGVGIYTSGQICSPSSIRMGNILLQNTDEINNSTNGYLHLNYRNSGNITLCIGGGNVGISHSSPSYKLDVNGLVRASGFIHSDYSINDAVLLAGGGYGRIFMMGTTRYYNNTSYDLSFHKLSGLFNNLVWVDGCIWNSASTSFLLSSDFYPYLYADSPSMRTIYRMDGNNMITVDGNGIVVISCSSYPRRVGFFYTGRA